MPGDDRARKDDSVDEPIRLICPRCDTLHRVRAITLGKRYHCKRCGAGLETLRPAVLRCRECGLSRAPVHVPVSQPHVCDRCISQPRLELSFPPQAALAALAEPEAPSAETEVRPGPDAPAEREAATGLHPEPAADADAAALRPAPAVTSGEAPRPAAATSSRAQAEAAAEPASARDAPSPADPGGTSPLSGDATGAAEETSTAPSGGTGEAAGGDTASGPAAAEQPPALREERAFRAIRQVVEEIQSPLVREIERSRRSLPLWVQGAAAVALLLLAGIFYSAMQEWRRQAEERGARLEAVQASYDENLRTLTVARATLEQEREALGDYVTDLETRLEARRAQAERFFERARAYREMLIAAGFNPDLIPLESDGATPEGGAGAGRDEETAARTRGGAPGRTDGTGPALTP